MQRYSQTVARVLAGLITIAMLTWFLWPRGSEILNREEALFAFLVAFAVWIVTEIKESDEVIYRAATQNDIRLARELISYASDKFKTLLKDHDYHSPMNPQYFTELHLLLNEHEVGTAFFQDRRVMPLFDDFCRVLESFSTYMAEHSAPNQFGLQSIVPTEFAGQKARFQEEIKEANRLASHAWERLTPLIAKIKERIPEAFDEPISYDWFRSARIYSKLSSLEAGFDSLKK